MVEKLHTKEEILKMNKEELGKEHSLIFKIMANAEEKLLKEEEKFKKLCDSFHKNEIDLIEELFVKFNA